MKLDTIIISLLRNQYQRINIHRQILNLLPRICEIENGELESLLTFIRNGIISSDSKTIKIVPNFKITTQIYKLNLSKRLRVKGLQVIRSKKLVINYSTELWNHLSTNSQVPRVTLNTQQSKYYSV